MWRPWVLALALCAGGAAPLQLARVPYPVPSELVRSAEIDGAPFKYLSMGEEGAPPLLLIHGFGASGYHWRNNMPALADQGYRVIAPDLLGFGLSAKPVREYNSDLWVRQCSQVLEAERATTAGKALVCGNSLGGNVALTLAAERQDLVRGCALLNAAGRFADASVPAEETEEEESPDAGPVQALGDEIKQTFQNLVLKGSFYYTKQPARIEQVLRQVYLDPTNVDKDLIESIRAPSDDPNAAEVFCRIVSRTATGRMTRKDTIDGRLEQLPDDFPLYLLWGQQDPWIRPAAADRIQELRPQTKRVNLSAGHCPHDEAPQDVNEAILSFAKEMGMAPVRAR